MKSTTIIADCILRKMPPEERKRLGKRGWTAEECIAKQEIKSEKDLQRQIKQNLGSKGIYNVHQKMSEKSRLEVGTPDFIFCILDYMQRPVPMAFECKFGKGKLSEAQIKVKENMICNGWKYFEIRTLDQALNAMSYVSKNPMEVI